MELELDPLLIDRRRKAKRRWIAAATFAVLFAVVGWQWSSIRDHARSWRSKRLAAAAEESLLKSQIQEAFETAQAAYFLDPNEISANRAIARVLDASGNYVGALSFWHRVVDSRHVLISDKQALAEDLLKTGDLIQAEKVVATMRAEQPKSPPILRLAARTMAAQGQIADGLALVRESLEIDPENPEARLLAAIFLAQIGGESERSTALENFWALTEDSGPVGIRALEIVAGWPALSPEKTTQLIQRLRSRPAQDERLRLMALDLEMRAKPDQKEQILESILSEYAAKDADVRRQVGIWFNSHAAPEQTLKLLPESESFARKDLLLVHLDALASLKRWQDIRHLLDHRDVPLEGVYQQVFLARCATESGDRAEAETHWRRARTEAGNDPARLLFVAEYGEKSGEPAQAELVYRGMIQNSLTGRPVFEGLLRVVSQNGDTAAVRDVLAEMRKRFPDDTAIENDLAYFNLLLGQNVDSSRESAEKLRSAAPGNLAHRTTVALAHFRLNQPAAALQSYDGLTIPWNEVPASQRAVRVAALGLNGDAQAAQSEAAAIPIDKLRPEEKELIEPWIRP